jgi:hypothetical protein
MRAIYIGVAVLVVLVGAIFGFMNWRTNQRITAAYATPTPAPSASATSKPIQLTDGQAVGSPYFKTSATADTEKGGRGQDVDGIPCATQEYVTLHVHTHLALFANGKQVQVPKFIGAAATPQGGCLYWIHTHGTDGIIHVEAPQIDAPQGGDYNLGILFDIWGQPLMRDNIAGIKGPVTAFINGTQYDGDLRAIPLKSHQRVVLEVGTPVVPPPNYILPPND